MSRNGVVSAARSRAAKVHADRYWDCACGRRCWGNGGKASHQHACVVNMQAEVDMHLSLADQMATKDTYVAQQSVERHKYQAGEAQRLLNARVEKERQS